MNKTLRTYKRKERNPKIRMVSVFVIDRYTGDLYYAKEGSVAFPFHAMQPKGTSTPAFVSDLIGINSKDFGLQNVITPMTPYSNTPNTIYIAWTSEIPKYKTDNASMMTYKSSLSEFFKHDPINDSGLFRIASPIIAKSIQATVAQDE